MEEFFRVLPISIIVYLLMSSGGVLRLFADQLRYEMMVPVTSTSVVLTLFLFGTVNQLKIGVSIVAILCISIYLIAFINLVKGMIRNGIDDLKERLPLLFSPCAILLFVFMIVM